MQKVTQNTAASAEEGAAASEQMSGHAESMRHSVGHLLLLVQGDNVIARNSQQESSREFSRTIRRIPKAFNRGSAGGPSSRNARERRVESTSTATVNPEHAFPLDDAEFSNFQ